LKRKLSNAKAKLNASKYKGLKIEPGQYEEFLSQIDVN